MTALVSKALRDVIRSESRREAGNVRKSLERLYSAHAREANRRLKLNLTLDEQARLVENHVTRMMR